MTDQQIDDEFERIIGAMRVLHGQIQKRERKAEQGTSRRITMKNCRADLRKATDELKWSWSTFRASTASTDDVA